jgi:hypothetical protein
LTSLITLPLRSTDRTWRESGDMSDERPRQFFLAETPASEILDGMNLRFTMTPRPFVPGDSIAAKSPKDEWFHFLVERPEGEDGAVVSCNVPPLFWTLHFHVVHLERRAVPVRVR